MSSLSEQILKVVITQPGISKRSLKAQVSALRDQNYGQGDFIGSFNNVLNKLISRNEIINKNGFRLNVTCSRQLAPNPKIKLARMETKKKTRQLATMQAKKKKKTKIHHKGNQLKEQELINICSLCNEETTLCESCEHAICLHCGMYFNDLEHQSHSIL